MQSDNRPSLAALLQHISPDPNTTNGIEVETDDERVQIAGLLRYLTLSKSPFKFDAVSEGENDEDILQDSDGSKLLTDDVPAPDLLSNTPGLAIKTKINLNIDPLPKEIVQKIDPACSFRPVGRDGELLVPVVGVFDCTWNGAPTSLMEKSEVWAGSEYGATTWLMSKRLGTFPTPVDEAVVRSLRGLDGTESNISVVAKLTGKRYSETKSRTIGRYTASLVTQGDNHITLLTAAYCVLFDRLWCQVIGGKRQLIPSILAQHQIITADTDCALFLREFNRPIIFVTKNPRYVNFWRNVCADGMNFASLVETGGKTYGSPWANMGFKGLLTSLILSEADSNDDDLELLDMQEALEDYIVHHGLFAQAEAASRLASRLPWLVKYKFIDCMPLPVHSVDLLHSLQTVGGSLPTEDITFRIPPRFIIGTLLIAGHLLETRFNHWMWENLDLEVARTSLAAAWRKLFYFWETGCRMSSSPWNVPSMKEVHEVGEFLGHMRYTQRADQKFRTPGTNTSYWEAALVGPVSGTAVHAVLSSQQPMSVVVGGTVISVSAGWFAKIRGSNLFGDRLFVPPYDDFPFPTEQVSAAHLTDTERGQAYAQSDLPHFELVQLQFGRNRPISSFQQIWFSLLPSFPPGIGLPTNGQFRDAYLTLAPPPASTKSDINPSGGVELAASDHDAEQGITRVSVGWESVDPPTGGDIIRVPGSIDSALRAFVDALRGSGIEANLEDVKDIATSEGWDGKRRINTRDLGRLCEHFRVELVLENEWLGSLRYIRSKGDLRIRLVYLENGQFGWVREGIEKGKPDSKRKSVKFVPEI